MFELITHLHHVTHFQQLHALGNWEVGVLEFGPGPPLRRKTCVFILQGLLSSPALALLTAKTGWPNR
jgi:hypothetical protein